MKRFTLLALVLILAISVFLVGCGNNPASESNTDNPDSSKEDTTENVTLRLSGWASSESETKVLLDQIAAFEDKYPNINVEYEPINGDYMQQIQMMMASKDEPDVFYMDVAFAQDYIGQDVLEDLTPYIEANGTDVDDFYPSLLQAFQDSEGKIYGLPKDYSTLALVYNKDVLEAAGVEVPTTWDELVEAAKAVTTEDMVGLSVHHELPRLGPFIYQNGGQIVQEDGSVTINTPEAVEALQFYHDLIAKHKAADTPANLGDGWQGDSFKNKKAAMVVEGPWMVGFLQDNAPDINYGVAELPVNKDKGTYAFTVAYVMSQNSKHKDEAYKLLEFMTGPEAQQITAEGGLAIPSRASLADTFVEKYPEREAWVVGAEYATPWSLGLNFNRKNEAIGQAIEAVFVAGKSPKEAFDEAQQKINELK